MPWISFLISAVIVVFAAIKLAQYGDVIAVRTKLGGLLVGTVLLAAATSLPELIASISSFQVGLPDLAAGNLFGSNMVNMFILALVDIINYQVPLLRRVAITHTLTAALGAAMITLSVIFIIGDLDLVIGWVGIGSLVLVLLYFGGTWLVQQEGRLAGGSARPPAIVPAADFPSLRRGLVGFLVAAAVLVAIVPLLVNASAEIAEITGLGATFIGTALLSVVTSLPELLAAMAAVRIGATELAVGNLFGSTVFNMLGVGLVDFFYLKGSFLGAIDDSFAIVGLLGLLLTIMALFANLARLERRVLFIELDAVAIALVYLGGMLLLFFRGIGM